MAFCATTGSEGMLAGITLGIALVPEGISDGTRHLHGDRIMAAGSTRVLVRRAAAIETLGAITFLCVDKTGTLTENKMSVATVWAAGQLHPLDGRCDLRRLRTSCRSRPLASAVHSGRSDGSRH